MIRVSYWQFRLPLYVALAGLVVVAATAGATGPSLAHLYDTTVGTCTPTHGGCADALVLFNNQDVLLRAVVQTLSLALPAIIGMFWGAPLVARELETGTFRLAWTQSRSRLTWFAGKLIVVGLSALAVQGLLSLALTWWWSPVERANPTRFSPAVFGTFGVAPLGYVLFALALGIAVGTVFRRTLPAMAVTLVGFAGVRLAVSLWIRPHFAAAVRSVVSLNQSSDIGVGFLGHAQMGLRYYPPDLPNAWLLSSTVTNAAGQRTSGTVLSQQCPSLIQAGAGRGNMDQAINSCTATLSKTFHDTLLYQPASRYWPFQWAELGLFAALAALLLVFTAWRLRRQ
jgi:ABC-type transport system involved in multi-copper enzyme maturation permease subunit